MLLMGLSHCQNVRQNTAQYRMRSTKETKTKNGYKKVDKVS